MLWTTGFCALWDLYGTFLRFWKTSTFLLHKDCLSIFKACNASLELPLLCVHGADSFMCTWGRFLLLVTGNVEVPFLLQVPD